MDVVRVAEQFPPRPGGLAPGILALSLEQHRRGHRVTVITHAAPGSEQFDRDLPFPVRRVPARTLVQLGWRACEVLQQLPYRPDVIHGHGPAAAAVLLRRGKRTAPVVVTLHAVRKYQFAALRGLKHTIGQYSQSTGLPVRRAPRLYPRWSPHLYWELLLERYVCTRSNHLALVAEYFALQVEQYYDVRPDRYTVTYNGSDFDASTASSKTHARAMLGCAAGEKVILYVGRLDWVKQAHLLAQALPLVSQQNVAARLVLVGRGDQTNDLCALVDQLGLRDRVSVVDWIPHEKLVDVYSAADCVCLPSLWEGLPKVVLEAMSLGVPVLASDIPANRSVLENGLTGFLVSEASPHAWASAILRVLSDPVEGHNRARLAARRVEERYRWHHVADRLDEAYARVLQAARHETR